MPDCLPAFQNRPAPLFSTEKSAFFANKNFLVCKSFKINNYNYKKNTIVIINILWLKSTAI